jgi:hypothetical protein
MVILLKHSAGLFLTSPICKVEHIKDAIFFTSKRNKTVAATGIRPKIYDIPFNEPVAIIMDQKIVNPSVLKIVDEKQNYLYVWNYRLFKCISSLWCFFYMKRCQKL